MANRLVGESSPYLRQHAHNPVDWYPWGEEAFAKSRNEDKPIFLSVGYSTCHWCHVMERESFENSGIAEVLNREFVPIKVDREERPDIDRVYMTFVQATTGAGGWPMSVFLTPELKPFFGGTYFPPQTQYGRPGFKRILEALAEAWHRDRAKIDESSADVIRQMQDQEQSASDYKHALDAGVLDSAFHYFRRTFDTRRGGFGDAPKFPRPVTLNFLHRYYFRTRNEEALEMSLATLRAMRAGGMYDQLGGGFHRYSVDAEWFVPHFEKMLYDQAQLAISYLEAYQMTKEAFYADAARGIFEYVLRDMTHAEGGFYSAEDADSVIDPAAPNHKGEGAFYVWSWDEVHAVLSASEAAEFCEYYGVERDGNVSNDPHEEFTGKNILYVARADAARERGLEKARRKLLEVRERRPRPDRDDKILTSWNSLMISAFAKGAQILGDEAYGTAARRATDFIIRNMYDATRGTLLRRYREGSAGIAGFLDDYAFFVQGLLDVYETDFDPRRLELAIVLTDKMRELFEDRERGGFFTTAEGDPSLVMRMKDDYDGAEPAGNSVALFNLLRLAAITGRDDYQAAAKKTLDALGLRIANQPVAVPQMLAALEFSLAPHRQVVFAGDVHSESMTALLRVFRGYFQPNTVVMMADNGMVAAVSDMKAIDGCATAYVCENFACQLPTSDVSRFDELLK